MKILMIDTALDGHHIAYLGEIVRGCTYDFTLVLPQMTDAYGHSKIITYSPVDLVNKEFVSYVKWMKELAQIAKKEKPDIVHFLVGDVYYKYFGIGLGLFKEFKTIITLHWVREGVLNQFSLKTFCHKVNHVVVHSSCVWHQYVIRCEERDRLIDYLNAKEIGTIIHYPIPPHLAEAYRYLGHKEGFLPITEHLAKTVLSIPMYNGMTEEEQTYVINALNEFE